MDFGGGAGRWPTRYGALEAISSFSTIVIIYDNPSPYQTDT
jgi:hypothetical protein